MGRARADALHGEEALLQRHPVAGIPGERARGADDPMAGNDDRQRVPAERLRHGAGGGRLTQLARDPRVRPHGAIGNAHRRLEHGAVKLAPRESQVERPLEPVPPALDVLEQVSVQRLDLGAVRERLDGLVAVEPRMGEVAAAGEILDARHALLGPRNQDRTERRGKDPVEERAAPEVGETRRQALARQLFGGRGRPAPHAHGALDRAVADKVLAAACARARVRLDARRCRGVRVADGGGDERRLDLLAHGRLALHLSSLPSGSSYPFRLRRILRRAWNTWARALSGEQSRLRPMAS